MEDNDWSEDINRRDDVDFQEEVGKMLIQKTFDLP